MGTPVAGFDSAPEALAQHHQSGVEELMNIFVDRAQSLYRIAMRQLENRADAEDRRAAASVPARCRRHGMEA